MRHAFDLFRFDGRIGRRAYLAAGLVLFALKYPVDLLIARAFGHPWNPLMYVSPRVSPLLHAGVDRRLWIGLAAWALPFVWMGVALTARRLRDVGVSPFWAGLFFLPFAHYALFAALAVAPGRGPEAPPAGPDVGPYRGGGLPAPEPAPPSLLTRIIPGSLGLAYLFSVVTSLGGALLSYVLSVQVSQVFGVTLFIALPFAAGFWVAFCVSYRRTIGFGRAFSYAASLPLIGLLLLLALGWEGLACILMSTPILFGFVAFGARVGWAISSASLARVAPVVVLLMVPLCLGVDLVRPHAGEPFSVVSSVRVAAPPEVVWRHVVSFPPIDAPPAPIFAVVAMPIEARLDGHSVGSLRRCIFTNGTFVEPIQVWDEPRELRFGVQSQPGNIDDYVAIRGGQFLLHDNGDGSTTIEGTTWYDLKVAPVVYWRAWAGTFLHAVHMRVLKHIARLAEHPEREVAQAAAQPAWMASANETCACTRHAAAHP